jgi:hypothetical protein
VTLGQHEPHPLVHRRECERRGASRLLGSDGEQAPEHCFVLAKGLVSLLNRGEQRDDGITRVDLAGSPGSGFS